VQFDFRAELLKNGGVIASGESLSNNQLLTDAAKAKQISLSFTNFQTTTLASGDVLSLKVLAKESGKGKKSSTGQVVVYYDSASRAAQFGISVPANSPPLANAGPDQTVFVGDTVTLNGSASSDGDGDPLTFNWAFVSRPSGSVAALSDPSAVSPTFQVDRPGSYTIRLTVNDGKVDSVADTVIVSTLNSRPVANAGPDQTSFVGNTVTLDGSASSDFDGDPLNYRWSLVSRPAGSTATLQNPTSVNPSFVIDKFGEYLVQLIVNDGFIDSVAATVKISTLNSAPVAKAGANQTAAVGDLITLDGSGSTDVDGNALTYSWSMTAKPAGSVAALENSFTVNPTFVIDKPGNYVIQLIVNDGAWIACLPRLLSPPSILLQWPMPVPIRLFSSATLCSSTVPAQPMSMETCWDLPGRLSPSRRTAKRRSPIPSSSIQISPSTLPAAMLLNWPSPTVQSAANPAR